MGCILAVGWACLDYRFYLESWPPTPGRNPARRFREALGGPAAVACRTVVRLGGQARLLSRRGDDPLGHRLAALVASEGIVARWTLGEKTPISGVLVAPDGERYIIPYRGGLPPNPPESWQSLLNGARAILADLRWPEGALAVLQEAHRLGIPRVLDLDHLDPTAWELASWSSHIVASAEVLEALGGIEGLAASFPKQFVAGTRGAKGVVWPGGSLAALPVTPLDTTGAGDAFHGAFTYALALGWAEEGALRLANVVAGLQAAKGEPPTWEEVGLWI